MNRRNLAQLLVFLGILLFALDVYGGYVVMHFWNDTPKSQNIIFGCTMFFMSASGYLALFEIWRQHGKP